MSQAVQQFLSEICAYLYGHVDLYIQVKKHNSSEDLTANSPNGERFPTVEEELFNDSAEELKHE